MIVGNTLLPLDLIDGLLLGAAPFTSLDFEGVQSYDHILDPCYRRCMAMRVACLHYGQWVRGSILEDFIDIASALHSGFGTTVMYWMRLETTARQKLQKYMGGIEGITAGVQVS